MTQFNLEQGLSRKEKVCGGTGLEKRGPWPGVFSTGFSMDTLVPMCTTSGSHLGVTLDRLLIEMVIGFLCVVSFVF